MTMQDQSPVSNSWADQKGHKEVQLQNPWMWANSINALKVNLTWRTHPHRIVARSKLTQGKIVNLYTGSYWVHATNSFGLPTHVRGIDSVLPSRLTPGVTMRDRYLIPAVLAAGSLATPFDTTVEQGRGVLPAGAPWPAALAGLFCQNLFQWLDLAEVAGGWGSWRPRSRSMPVTAWIHKHESETICRQMQSVGQKIHWLVHLFIQHTVAAEKRSNVCCCSADCVCAHRNFTFIWSRQIPA